MRRFFLRAALCAALAILLLPGAASAQTALVIKPLIEKTVAALPAGELFWRIENLPTVDAARAAAGEWSLVTEAAGKVWLFTLGPAGAATPGAVKAAEVGPIPRVAAAEYLLRINEASGPPGAVTSVHSHPGSEAFFVLAGEQSIRGAHGTMVVKAGQPEAGNAPAMAMQVSSSGTTGLQSLVMFVVDAGKPFSSPGTLP
jgi:hypothetical protein